MRTSFQIADNVVQYHSCLYFNLSVKRKILLFHVNKSAVITKAGVFFFVACGTNIHLNIFDEDLKYSVFKTNKCLV